VGRATEEFGGLTGRQVSLILGVPETRVNQAILPTADRAAIFMGTHLAAWQRMMADRLEVPTPGMLDILRRRQAFLQALRNNGGLRLTQEWEVELLANVENLAL